MSTPADLLTPLLHQLNLSPTEQQLYLCGLGQSEISVNELVAKSGVNRTTAYHALNTLKQKGFLSESKSRGKLVYRMTGPQDLEHLLDLHKARLETQKQQLRELAHLFPVSNGELDQSAHVEKYEGMDGIKQAIEKALYCKSREWNIIAPRHNFFVEAGKEYSKYYMQTRRSRGIKARTLWEPDESQTEHLSLEQLATRKPRYLAPEFRGRFNSIVIMFDDKALFIPPLVQQNAVIVESDAIISTLRVLFDALWLVADKPL